MRPQRGRSGNSVARIGFCGRISAAERAAGSGEPGASARTPRPQDRKGCSMATTSPEAAPRPLPVGTVSLTSPYQFYVGMAAVIVAIAIAGFIPTYWAPVARGGFVGAP